MSKFFGRKLYGHTMRGNRIHHKNKAIEQGLRTAFDAPAPAPERKSAFLFSLLTADFPRTSRLDFLIAQAGYIRKGIWILPLITAPLIVLLLNMLSEGNTAHFIWIVSSFLPFIALAGFTEIARSTSYNMAELEMSCKYSLSHVLLARFGILGLTEAILFAVIIAAFWHAGAADVISSFGAGIAGLGSFGTDAVGMSDADIINNFGAGLAGTSDADAAGGFGAAGSASAMNLLRLGAYLFVPFLLTCALSLLVLDILRSRESLYICGGIACFVCIGNALLSNHHVYFETIFADDYVPFWNIAFIVLLLCTVWGLVKLIRRTEETQWNWSLTA